MMEEDEQLKILELARIPEHSVPLVAALSGGEPFIIGDWLFFTADDWLMAVGYPLKGVYSHAGFETALNHAREKTGARVFFAIGPDLPPAIGQNITERDRFHVLSVHAPIPRRLANQAARAANSLRVREGAVFTPAHRRLFAEFLETSGEAINPRVAELYAKTPQAMAKGTLRLLDAVDHNGNLAASLLLDYNPHKFTSYIIGAHSRAHYTPHATDLLFAEMLDRSKKAGKQYIHLGLGVNDGILRFKRKWGARPSWPYLYAEWEEKFPAKKTVDNPARALAMAIMRQGNTSGRRLPETAAIRPFAMLWRVEKENSISWIGGTAHFFRDSFEPSFRKLFSRVDNVLFEGPLDAAFMSRMAEAGKILPPGHMPLADMLTADEIDRLEDVVLGHGGFLAGLMDDRRKRRVDIRWLLRAALPWHAFFTLWTTFLERLGWHESVDMEAWRIAREMGKNVVAMETFEEQLESLNSLPVERVIRFFRDCKSWKGRARQNLRAYLAGDLEKMMGSSAEFPTRTEHVVGRRDQRFRERMRPWLERGRAAVFVGTAHMVNLRHMLAADGFKVSQEPFGIWPKLHQSWRGLVRPDEKVTWQL